MRIALADDSALFRTGLQRLLADLGVDVLYAVGTIEEFLERAADQPPDIAILDIRMPPSFTDEGLRAAQTLRLRNPDVGVLLLSTYAESPYLAQLLTIGASKVGYLLKDRVDDPKTLIEALLRLNAGECVIDGELVSMLIRHERHKTQLNRLTEHERSVLQLMAEGRSNAGISRQLFLSLKTVEAHVGSVFSKLDLPLEAVDNRRVMAVLTWMRARGLDPKGASAEPR
jgi:DNA-binding NarL/FixJ family response regulator